MTILGGVGCGLFIVTLTILIAIRLRSSALRRYASSPSSTSSQGRSASVLHHRSVGLLPSSASTTTTATAGNGNGAGSELTTWIKAAGEANHRQESEDLLHCSPGE